MKIEELLFESEQRFSTGIRKQTIINPVYLDPAKWPDLKTWEGNPADYKFKGAMNKAYQSLKKILNRNGFDFTYMGLGSYPTNWGDKTLYRFVAISEPLIWEKHESHSPGRGENRVYVAGEMMKTSDFLSIPSQLQDQYISKTAGTPIDEIMSKYFKIRGSYTDNNGIVDVDGKIEFKVAHQVDKLPIKFGKITGPEWPGAHFICNSAGLKTLEGSPSVVNGWFSCSHNQLTSLIGGPKIVGNYYCDDNPLTSLDGLAPEINGEVSIPYNPSFPLLRLLSIKNLTRIFIKENEEVQEILTKYLGQGQSGILACAAELNRAGFRGNARK